jgi:hypothetical protein
MIFSRIAAIGRLEGGSLASLEVEVDDRVALEMGAVRLPGSPDGQAIEEVRKVRVLLLEPAAEHGEVERLAEPARSGEEEHLDARAVHDLPDEVRFVDVLEPGLAHGAEVVDADGDRGRIHGLDRE